MRIGYLWQILGASALFVGAGLAQAASISFGPPVSQTASLNDTVSFEVTADFTDQATMGGNFEVVYDPGVLSFDSFTYNNAFLNTGATSVAPIQDTGLVSLGFDALSNGYNSDMVMGTLSFLAVGVGTDNLSVTDSRDYPFQDTINWNNINVNYTQGLSVQVNAVPLPAALWLFLSGLSLLGFKGRRRAA